MAQNTEYDKASVPPTTKPLLAAPNGPHSNTDKRAHLRVGSDEGTDVGVLGTPLQFEFSGKTAMNRFLKAPMTERLCTWNDMEKGEDEVSSG